jgi:CsoR family transcriptional regulator, copper-sensing transcriptional repressor
MSHSREKSRIAVKKATSLLQKIQKMIEEDAYCIDIMQQNLAVIGLLKSAHHSLMESHVDHCVKAALETGNATRKQKMIDEILRVSKLANK